MFCLKRNMIPFQLFDLFFFILSTELTCHDKYTGDCSVDFAGRCNEYTVQLLCQKTCNTCSLGNDNLFHLSDSWILYFQSLCWILNKNVNKCFGNINRTNEIDRDLEIY